jgi:DNA-binding response OmpR family regulator
MKKKILLVDDDLELCQELEEIIRDAGYLVDVINDGLKAEALLKKKKYGLIILDFRIPGLNGFALLEKMEISGGRTKVILVTGRPDIEKLFDNKELSHLVCSVMRKPFNIADLLIQLKHHLRR